MRLLIFSLLLMLTNKSTAQAGIDQVPDDIFAPIQNKYYSIARSSLKSVGNNSAAVFPPSAYLNCLENIKRVYFIEGNYAGALDLLLGEDEAENNNLAMQFDMPEFTENMQQVINRIGKKINADFIRPKFYEDLSDIYDQIGDHQKALSYQLKSLELLRRTKPLDKEEYIRNSILLGEKYMYVNQLDSADKIYNLITQESSLNRDSANHVRNLFLKALITQKQHKLYKTIDIYKQIFSYKKTLPQYYEMALNLGKLYTQTRQYYLADSVLARNFSILHKLNYASVIFEHIAEAWCENLLYMNKTAQASKTLISLMRWMIHKTYINSKGLTEEEEIIYAKRIDGILNVLYTILSNNSTEENQKLMLDVLLLELQYRNLVLLNKKELGKHSQPKMYYSIDKSGVVKPVPGVKTFIAQQYSLPYNKRNLNIDSLKEISDQEDRKRAAKGFYESPDERIKMNIMTTATQQGTTNIEFVRFNYKSPGIIKDSAIYAAFIFGQSLSNAVFVRLCSEEQIIKMLKDENGELIDEDQLSDKLYSSASNYSTEFYKLIWAPLNPYLKNISNINYSPAGILNNISVGAMYNGKDYLSDIFGIHFFSSLSDASDYYTAYEKPVEINVWGNMNYYFEKNKGGTNVNYKLENTGVSQKEKLKKDADTSLFDPLGDYEVTELKKICSNKHLSFKSYEVNYATEDSFKNEAINAKGVLHISTHGFYINLDKTKSNELLPGNFMAANKNPLFRSGLAFSGVNYYWKNGIHPPGTSDDGILTPYEIEQLDLHNVQLVALSACETGLGESTYTEGNLGLQRAFKLAGVHYALVSLWRVNQKITADLFKQFYDNWFSGQPLSTALYNAQKSIRKEHPSPYFWAGFVLIE